MAESGLGALDSKESNKRKTSNKTIKAPLAAVDRSDRIEEGRTVPGRQAGRRWVTSVSLTEAARVLLDNERIARSKKPTYAILAIEALRATEDQLRNLAVERKEASSTSKWDDEVAQAEHLEGAHRPTSLSMSPGQASALGELAHDLGWSLNLTVDTAVVMHFGEQS